MAKLIREPLLHFLLIGLALFVLFSAVSGSRGGADRRILINAATVDAIVQRHRSVWQRPPTPNELRGLIDRQVREEIFYREGVAMGLDRDDPIVRRRVQQKVDVMAEESMDEAAPAAAGLAEYLRAHAERYAHPAIVSFDQVMFDPVRHRARLEADLLAALARLRAGANPDSLGDGSHSLLPAAVTGVPSDRLAGDFGEDFARSVLALPIDQWSGPVASAYGVHLVRVNSRTPGRPAALEEVRAAVERDWENERRVRASEEYYAKLRRKYDVVIEAAGPPARAESRATE